MFARTRYSIAQTAGATARRTRATGQVLVMFVLFLLVLLGVSALAIDYASWLLTDRALQNVSDHAALAGASQFEQRETQGDCGGVSIANCQTARVQAWSSLNNELKLGMTDSMVGCLAAAGDSPADGDVNTSRCTSQAVVTFRDRIWVATPPPSYAAYTGPGIRGRYASNYGVVFVRVDRQVTAFLSGAFGVRPDPRHGWATAGAIPTDFALEIFCRDAAEPYQNCRNDGLSIAGGGSNASGIRLIRGDIGSNESLQLTAQQNRGVIVEAGNVFLVNGACGNSTWNCPQSPAVPGGIADEDPTAPGNTAIMRNAFYIPPIPVPQFASPVTGTIESATCAGASASNLCVPDQGIYECFSPTGSTLPRCGLPTVDNVNGTVTCVGVDGGVAGLHFYATGVSSGNSILNADAAHPQQNANKWRNMAPDTANTGSPDDDYVNGDGDTLVTPANPSNDFVYTNDIDVRSGSGPFTTSFTVNVGAAGNRQPGLSTIRYTAFKVDGGVPNNTLNPVTLQVTLLNGGGGTILADPTVRTLTDVPQQFEYNVGAGVISANGNYNSLQLRFTFTSSGSQTAVDERGGAIAWAGIQHPDPQPPTPPMIPPGYYQGIEIANDGCAVLDATGEYSALLDWQMPGIYRFGGDNSNNTRLELGSDAYLIGDGVTLVFDPPCGQVAGNTNCWPDSGSQRGVALGADSALVLNTATTANAAGVTPCTPYEEFGPYNPSGPLSLLPYSAMCAAWAFDPTATAGIRPGSASWPACDLANPDSGSHCIERSSYLPTAGYRGITFYFTPAAWPPNGISNRFEMQGGASGLAFRGVLYAPYDDVAISGKNGFDTVGQVLAWTAKFHGGDATIDLDYPYEYVGAKPYLLEPTIINN